ncbi:hypothetical protein JCM19239_1472 [Vibrio variabilis]|uniref:Uncharacterized protein n=1 Tax=Vibrio variabilis TaxID=990271 RepID=A0ABQ0JG58_9VIBR|nr:hypothetical protein JCM19239_1472 [Vibrio variabilis]
MWAAPAPPPSPPEPKGEIKPVNPSEFKLSDLYIKQGDDR